MLKRRSKNVKQTLKLLVCIKAFLQLYRVPTLTLVDVGAFCQSIFNENQKQNCQYPYVTPTKNLSAAP